MNTTPLLVTRTLRTRSQIRSQIKTEFTVPGVPLSQKLIVSDCRTPYGPELGSARLSRRLSKA